MDIMVFMQEEIVITAETAPDYVNHPEFASALRRELWLQGNLEHQLREHGQTKVYRWLKGRHEVDPSTSPYCLEAHRRFGKSHFLLILACEVGFKYPNAVIKYGAPDKNQAASIVIPNLSKVLEHCPFDIRPKKTSIEGIITYRIKNPRWEDPFAESWLQIYGLNNNPDSMRGTATDLLIIDEARDVKNLKYIVEEVLSYQFMGRYDAIGFHPMCVMISTPPKSMAHDFVAPPDGYVPLAKRKKRHMVITAKDNRDFTEADEKVVLDIVGSKDTIGWRREAMCEHITDEEEMIVPEWLSVRDRCIQEWKRPNWLYPEDVADIGWEDYCHILFGYIDYANQKLIIEDEARAHYSTPAQLADLWFAKDEQLWADKPQTDETLYKPGVVAPYFYELTRYSDGDLLTLQGLSIDHDLPVAPVQKHDAAATLASLRAAIASERIIIHPRCKDLIYQLDNGIWNEKRTDWVRNDKLGHCDGIAALGYFNRMARWADNPVPVIDAQETPERIVRNRKRRGFRSVRSNSPLIRAFNNE